MQGRGCLAHSIISFGREGSCQLTGFGWEARTVPPSGGVSRAQVHRDCSLHLGNARVPPSSPAVEGSEDGGDGRGASGHERGHPRLRQLLMHLREKRHRSREKPIIQPRGLGTGRSVDLQPDTHGCPGKHGRQLWVRCGSPTAPSSSEDVNPSPDAVIDILSTDGAPNEMLGALWNGPAKSPGNQRGCSLREV